MTAARLKVLAPLLVLAMLVAGLVLTFRDSNDQKHVTVLFPSTTSLYEGAQVKVLGVRIGNVESIEVEGTHVRVEIAYDDEYALPADAHAVIVPPSVVGDRFVQLAPAYVSGPALADDAVLGLDRSSVPLELEDTYRALDQIAGDLGPNGANKDGALSGVVSAAAENLRGRGDALNTTIRELAAAISVLATSSDDIQGTTSNLADLNSTLAGSDATIRSLVANLIAVSTELNGQSDTLSDAVTRLDRTLARVATFAKENRAALKSDVDSLTSVSGVLRRHTRELEELTDLAPVGLVNLMRTYVPRNWDPTKPGQSSLEGRTGSQNLHAALLQDLDTQLSYSFALLCQSMPTEAKEQLAPFCVALEAAGGDLGRLIVELYGGDGGPTAPSAREVAR